MNFHSGSRVTHNILASLPIVTLNGEKLLITSLHTVLSFEYELLDFPLIDLMLYIHMYNSDQLVAISQNVLMYVVADTYNYPQIATPSVVILLNSM